jgi:hypothetical protein
LLVSTNLSVQLHTVAIALSVAISRAVTAILPITTAADLSEPRA